MPIPRNLQLGLGIAAIGALTYYFWSQHYNATCCGDGGCAAGCCGGACMSGDCCGCCFPGTQNRCGDQKLSANQIAQYASDAGFSGNDLVIAVAVALAESGGHTMAYNPETAAHAPTGHGSYGLWQIFTKVHTEYTGQDLRDPATNAQAAFAIYQAAKNTFNPWSTYNPHNSSTPMYLAHMADAQNAVAAEGLA